MKVHNGLFPPKFVFVFSMSLIISGSAHPQGYGASASVPASLRQPQFIHTGGRYITSQGIITAFVLFVRFADDNQASITWPNASILPRWAQNILNPNYKSSGDYTQNSLTHYFYENSYGKLHIIGDVYYVTLPYPEDHYYSMGDAFAARAAIETDALSQFATLIGNLGVDMRKYDNWTNRGMFNNLHEKDGVVDLCWMVVRNLHDENHTIQLNRAEAMLYSSKTIGSVSIKMGYPGSGISMFEDTWVGRLPRQTVINMCVSQYDNDGMHYPLIATMAHELSHYFFGAGHFGTPDHGSALSPSRSSSHMYPYAVNTGAVAGNFLGYEKIRLGWIASSDIQVVSSGTATITLPDMETTTSGIKIVKIRLDSTQSIFLENRSWTSIYEPKYVDLGFGKPLRPGLLAYLIPREDDYLSETPIQEICADGKWTWILQTNGGNGPGGYFGTASYGDVIAKSVPDPIKGYDEREDIHVLLKPSAKYWALFYPDAPSNGNLGKWYKGVNYIDENHSTGDYRGGINKLFQVGDVITPWSNGASHKWNGATDSFVPTTIGIEVTTYDSSSSCYTIMVVTSNPEQLSPSRPQNLTVLGRTSKHEPILSWTANREPDFAHYEVWRNVNTQGGLPSVFSLIASDTTNTFTDYGISVGTGSWEVYYKIRAIDITRKVSTFSDMLTLSSDGFLQH